MKRAVVVVLDTNSLDNSIASAFVIAPHPYFYSQEFSAPFNGRIDASRTVMVDLAFFIYREEDPDYTSRLHNVRIIISLIQRYTFQHWKSHTHSIKEAKIHSATESVKPCVKSAGHNTYTATTNTCLCGIRFAASASTPMSIHGLVRSTGVCGARLNFRICVMRVGVRESWWMRGIRRGGGDR